MATDPRDLNIDALKTAVLGSGTAFRIRARLQPAGGPGDKVFPPTYADGQDGKKHGTKYAMETRVVDGERKPSVLLDSVASQANRMELALLAARREDSIDLPLVSVDFGDSFPEIGKLSALEAPHRVYDALLRDATLDGAAFRATQVGRALTDTNVKDARAMFRHCPTALLFGAWDSTGPRGGLGNKFQRALVSEVVGIGVEAGTKVGSRIDPLQTAAGVKISVPKGDSDAWKVDAKGKGKPSEINHSNIAPTRDTEAGGVTLEYGLHTAVLSLPALRRLGFADWKREQSDAARVCLAALGLLAMALQQRVGYDFRSRCTLVPEAPATLELVSASGAVEAFSCDVATAESLLAAALDATDAADIRWNSDELILEPMPKLVQLVEESRKLHSMGRGDAE